MSEHPDWLYEDELPEGYPYDREFPPSRLIDGVRMFPALRAITPEGLEERGFTNTGGQTWEREIATLGYHSLAVEIGGGVSLEMSDGSGHQLPGIRTMADVDNQIRYLEGGTTNESEASE